MTEKVKYVSEIALGHLVQTVVAVASVVGIYYALVQDIQINTADIKANRNYINELKTDLHSNAASIQEVKKELRQEMQLQEQRVLQHVIETKDDVRWLVRRTKGNPDAD